MRGNLSSRKCADKGILESLIKLFLRSQAIQHCLYGILYFSNRQIIKTLASAISIATLFVAGRAIHIRQDNLISISWRRPITPIGRAIDCNCWSADCRGNMRRRAIYSDMQAALLQKSRHFPECSFTGQIIYWRITFSGQLISPLSLRY